MRIDFIKHNTYTFPYALLKSENVTKEAKTRNVSKDSIMNQLCAIQNFNIQFLGKTTPKPVYAIDREMNCTWFASANKAGAALGIPTPYILKCLSDDENKRAKYTGDYCFIHASKAETTKEDGTVEIDKKKSRKFLKQPKLQGQKVLMLKNADFTGWIKAINPYCFQVFQRQKKLLPQHAPISSDV